jgi:hypothetical protein
MRRRLRKMPHRPDSVGKMANAGVTLPPPAAIQPAQKAGLDGLTSGLAGRTGITVSEGGTDAPIRKLSIYERT